MILQANDYRGYRMLLALFMTVVMSLIGSGLQAGEETHLTPREELRKEYQDKILKQIGVISPTRDQIDAFRANMRAYFQERDGSLSRIFRQGGDYDKRVQLDLNKCSNRAMEAMAEVLNEEQLSQYRVLLDIANEQYLAINNLL